MEQLGLRPEPKSGSDEIVVASRDSRIFDDSSESDLQYSLWSLLPSSMCGFYHYVLHEDDAKLLVAGPATVEFNIEYT